MRSFFTLIGFATVAFAGLGWYFDWYRLSRQPAENGTQRIQVDLNGNKFADDVKKGLEQGSELIDKLREEKSQPAATPPATDKPATPTTTEKPSTLEVNPTSISVVKPGATN